MGVLTKNSTIHDLKIKILNYLNYLYTNDTTIHWKIKHNLIFLLFMKSNVCLLYPYFGNLKTR